MRVKTGRFAELGLMLTAVLLCFQGWFSLWQTEHKSSIMPDSFVPVCATVLICLFAAHLLIRKFAPRADPVLFPTAVALNGMGLLMIYRIDFALRQKGQATQFTGQFVLSFVGIVLMIAALAVLRDHRTLRRFTYLFLIAGILLLLSPMLPGIGKEIYGARLWIRIFGFSYQPAELGKICLVVFFAGYLVVQRDNLSLAGKKVCGLQLPQLRYLAPILVAWAICLGILAMERDFGTALLFFGLFVAMLYVSTERVSWLVIGGILSVFGGYAIVRAMPHIQARFTVWLHALDPAVYNAPHGSYQLVQGWFGMAGGGLFGTGFGQGHPTNSFAANSDFIIASFGEEIGLFGFTAILCLYLLFIFRAFRIGILLCDGFGKLLATGFGVVTALQCFVVVGGVTRVIPLSGLALPFLALGGSSLLANWIIVGILLRMSNDARRPQAAGNASLQSLTPADLEHIAKNMDINTGDETDINGTERETQIRPDSYPTEAVKL